MATKQPVYQQMSLDDVLFEDREKRYGAYILRKEYARFLLFGFLLMTALFLLGTVGPLLFQKYVADKQEKDPTEIDVSLSDLPPPPPPDENTPPPPPPPPKQETPPPPPPPVETKAYLPPKPTPKEEMKEPEKTIANIDSVKTAVVSNKDQKGEKQENTNAFVPQVTDPNGKGKAEPAPVAEPEPPKPEPKPAPEPEPDPNKFIPAQKKPEPVNMDDIKKEIGYPALAREGNIEGDVTLKILVDENGNYVKHNVLKQVHPILLKEVEKHVGKLKFTPAIQGNKPIKFWLVVPFKFKLQG